MLMSLFAALALAVRTRRGGRVVVVMVVVSGRVESRAMSLEAREEMEVELVMVDMVRLWDWERVASLTGMVGWERVLGLREAAAHCFGRRPRSRSCSFGVRDKTLAGQVTCRCRATRIP